MFACRGGPEDEGGGGIEGSGIVVVEEGRQGRHEVGKKHAAHRLGVVNGSPTWAGEAAAS